MRNLVLAAALAAFVTGSVQTRPPAAFDPVGKWTYATRDDAGAPITGTMEISGKPAPTRGR